MNSYPVHPVDPCVNLIFYKDAQDRQGNVSVMFTSRIV
jgi:hypothetical protein